MAMNILVETKVAPKVTFEKENPVLRAGLVAINEEGIQIDTNGEIISGAKIGDGNSTWEQLKYVSTTSEVIEKWLTIARGTTNSKLVTLPDLKFSYATIGVDDSGMVEEIVERLIANTNYFNIHENEIKENSDVGELNLTAMGIQDLEFHTTEAERFYKISKLSYTKNNEEQTTREYILYDDESHQLIEQLNSSLFLTDKKVEQLRESVFGAENGLEKQINDRLIPFTEVADNDYGLVPKPTVDQALGEYYLKANGSWSQIILQGDKIPLNIDTTTTVTEAITELQNRRGFNVQEGNFATKAYVVGVTDINDDTFKYHTSVYIDGAQGVLVGAAWNDYAECRVTKPIEAGRVVVENGDDTLSLATDRLLLGGNIVSDTYGMLIGQTEKAKTPIALCGRVLAYTYEDRNMFYPGAPVCTGPNGTVSLMSKDEVLHFPECIIGYVSAIPNYKEWNGVKINNRIWIKVI